MASLLTHKDLSKLLGVSETTVKSYRRKFPGCVPVANAGKPIRFTPEAADVCKRIRDLFELGMAVSEIRHRLSEEFDWIEVAEPKQKQLQKEPSLSDSKALPETFQPVATSVASLAKSMVGISQQQNSILKRLESLESRFVALDGLFRSVSGGTLEESCGSHSGSMDYADRLDRIESELADIMSFLKELNSSFVVNGKKHSESDTMYGHSLESDSARCFSGDEPYGAIAREQKNTHISQKDEEKIIAWSGLPLFAKNELGQYGNVAGRGGRSRFNINDLKAVLAHRILPPDHFTVSWKRSGQENWFLIEISWNGRKESWRLLLTPARTIKGMDIIVAERVFKNDMEVSTALLYEFIAEIIG